MTKSISADDRVLWMLADNLDSDAGHRGQHRQRHGPQQLRRVRQCRRRHGILSTRYLWTGREFEILTGLQYNRNRWYDPALGRWMSEDPIGFAGGD